MKLDKTTVDLILYYINRLDGVLGKTHLQKMLFLTDLISSKKFDAQITKIQYKRYKHGPYSQQLNDYTNFLEKKGFIEARKLKFFSDDSKTYIRFHVKKPINVKANLLEQLGPERMLLVDEVLNSFGNLSLQEVLEIVYNLEIIKKSKMNSPLEMAKSIKETADEPNGDETL